MRRLSIVLAALVWLANAAFAFSDPREVAAECGKHQGEELVKLALGCQDLSRCEIKNSIGWCVSDAPKIDAAIEAAGMQQAVFGWCGSGCAERAAKHSKDKLTDGRPAVCIGPKARIGFHVHVFLKPDGTFDRTSPPGTISPEIDKWIIWITKGKGLSPDGKLTVMEAKDPFRYKIFARCAPREEKISQAR